MPRDKPWLKMWTEWLGDAEMDRLSLAEQGAYWRVFSLCHDCGHLGEDGKHDGALILSGIPLSLAEIMKSLKISTEADVAIFNSMLDKMQKAGYLLWNSDTLYVVNYEESQRAATDTKADRARRQRERRERIAEEEKREAEKRTPPLIKGESKNTEERGETSHGNSHEKDVTMAELSRCYESYIGLLNPVDADRMREFIDYWQSHGGQLDWIEDGFKAAPVNKRRWPYVQAILERYIEQGGPDGRAAGRGKGEPGTGAAEPGRDGTHRRDPLAGAKQTGWKVIEDDEPRPEVEGDPH